MADVGISSLVKKGVYRSRDPIRNFKIRVQLDVKIVPTVTAASAASANIAQDIELRPLSEENTAVSETYVFEWQEKVFSKQERQIFESEANCSTTLHKKYNKEILASRHKVEPTKHLFTYIDADKFTGIAKKDETVTSNRWWNRNLNPLRQRKQNAASERRETTATTTPTEKMFIMASVEGMRTQPKRNVDTTGNATGEVILCTITVNSNGLITVSPDFCQDNDPPYVHTVQSDNGKTVAFEYKIFHASKQKQHPDHKQDAIVFPSLTNALPASNDQSDFDTPLPNTTRMFAFLEIVSAADFASDCLFMQYFLDLPLGWTLEQGPPTYGTTQTCYAKSEGNASTAYFCFPLNYVLSCETSSICATSPQLLLHVLSRDSWGCCRTEGYASTSIPSNSGCWTRQRSTWRPIDNNPASELRRFFIGGSLELEDVAYVSTPSTFQGKYLSKLGMRTTSCGEITVRMNITCQSQENMSGNRGTSGLLGVNVALGNKPLEASVAEVVEAFHRARRRMIAARESVMPDTLH